MVKFLKGLFKHAIIQEVMIKDAEKEDSWRRKWNAIGKVTWNPCKKC